MKKRIVVLSLGGSLIIPDEVDLNFLEKFKRLILRNRRKYKFIIVCGGGSIARKYISALRKAGLNEEFQSFSGISATRMNARFMNYLFGINPELGIPHTTETLRKYVKRQDIIFCGALEYKPRQTSDSTAAEIAKHFKAVFINLTNVAGLYNKNPKEHRDAKLILRISWSEFCRMANKNHYEPGQHFILDQTAAGIIMRARIKTYILGKDLKQLEAVLKGKDFKGSLIFG
ncbi:MAG: UMP kinase [Candidatus Pacearchaeota archaeon]|nr:UMP kinase [Nanoarchaeota archaeon]MDZ4226834.1 UMP kinase [Candidatus Pacearchaeota archaeon]